MTCEKCGAPVAMTDEDGGVKEGRFEEKYECVSGHLGWISGKAEAPAQDWDRTGTVFNG